jgi:carboxymethylenebutenolidase
MLGSFERMRMSDGADVVFYWARPPAHPRGGLVLVQEIFGVTAHIRELCDEYAADGYEVLAPALFDREHPGFEAEYTGPGFDRAIDLARKLHPFERSLADVQTCIDALAPAGPVFVVGYCYGGSVAWFAACRLNNVSAASSYYGSLVPASEETPRAPVVVHFGRYDQGIPMAGVEAFIARAPARTEVHVYEAGHGFNSDRRKDYHEPSAELARARTLALFRANGG